MHKRLLELRKNILNINQETFAEKIGITKSAVSSLETGKRNLTDRTITDICREFNVNENWLRFGEGDIFVEKPTELIDELTKEYELDALEKNLVKTFVESNDDERSLFMNFLTRLVDLQNNDIPVSDLSIDNFTERFNVLEKGDKKSTILIKDVDNNVLSKIKELVFSEVETDRDDFIEVYKVARSVDGTTPPTKEMIDKKVLQRLESAEPLSGEDDDF